MGYVILEGGRLSEFCRPWLAGQSAPAIPADIAHWAAHAEWLSFAVPLAELDELRVHVLVQIQIFSHPALEISLQLAVFYALSYGRVYPVHRPPGVRIDHEDGFFRGVEDYRVGGLVAYAIVG